MSEQSNGHLELVDRRTGATVGVVVPEGELRALRARVEQLETALGDVTKERDQARAELGEFHKMMHYYDEEGMLPPRRCELEAARRENYTLARFIEETKEQYRRNAAEEEP